MNFDKRQQMHIDNLIKAKYTEAYNKAQLTLPALVGEKLEPLNLKLREAYDKLRVQSIETAAAHLGAHAPEQVAKLLDEQIKVDVSGAVFVVDDKGERRYSKDGAPLSVQAAVKGFLDANSHMVKRPLSVSGSQGSWFGRLLD